MIHNNFRYQNHQNERHPDKCSNFENSKKQLYISKKDWDTGTVPCHPCLRGLQMRGLLWRFCLAGYKSRRCRLTRRTRRTRLTARLTLNLTHLIRWFWIRSSLDSAGFFEWLNIEPFVRIEPTSHFFKNRHGAVGCVTHVTHVWWKDGPKSWVADVKDVEDIDDSPNWFSLTQRTGNLQHFDFRPSSTKQCSKNTV